MDGSCMQTPDITTFPHAIRLFCEWLQDLRTAPDRALRRSVLALRREYERTLGEVLTKYNERIVTRSPWTRPSWQSGKSKEILLSCNYKNNVRGRTTERVAEARSAFRAGPGAMTYWAR